MKRLNVKNNRRKKQFLAIILSLIAGVTFSQISFAKSSLTPDDEAMFSQNNILFYEPCSTDDGSSNSSNASICNANLPAETLKRLESENIKQKAEQNMERYKYASDQTGVMWQVIAALHYREGGMSPDQSILNGEKLYDHINVDGKRISSNANEDAKNAAEHLISAGKSVYNVDITKNQSKDALAKAFLAYNRGNMYTSKCGEDVPYTSSPYVMNYYDSQHMEMTWIHADSYCGSTRINGVEGSKNTQLGALVILSYLCGDDEDAGASIDSGSDDLDAPDTSDGNVSNDSDITGGAKAISDTAAQLAWPKGTDSSKYHTKEGSGRFPAYANAVEELGLSGHGHTYQPDCGDFVETVVKYSGYDKNYGKTNSYIQKHPELWEFIEWDDGDTSKLRAGDIVYGKGRSSGTGQHWWIVTEIDGKLYRAEASYTNDNWGRITKAVSGTWKKYNHQWIYRAKGGGSSKPSCDANFEGSKNINATGAALAWPLGTDEEKYTLASGKVLESVLTSPGQTTEFPGTGSGNLEFQKAWVKAKLWKHTSLYDGTQDGRYSWRYGAYCSGFTATVVRYSGYDKSFTSTASVGGYEQAKHAMEHSDLWDVTVWDGEKSSLQGGDILLSAEHSWMVVEDSTGELYVAEGSLHSYTFGHIVKYHKSYNSKTYRIRAKHANNSNAGVSVTDGVKTSSTTGTITSSVQNSQNIGAVARFFAWPEGTDPKTTIRGPKEPEVWKTLLKDNGFSNFSETAMGKDCGVFVGGVLRYSGLVTRIKHKNGQGSVPIVPSEVDEGENGWYRVDTDGTKESELQDGDVIFHYIGGEIKHFSIFLRGEKGEALTAQASHGDWYGRISKYHPYGQEVVYRNKNNKTGNISGNGNECNLCPMEENSVTNADGSLKEGGFSSAEEAERAVMDLYRQYKGNATSDFSTLMCTKGERSDYGGVCEVPSQDNCTTFSLWFVKTFLGWNAKLGGNGYDTADFVYNTYHSKYPKITRSNNPSPYSIVSWNSSMPSPGGSSNHTGVVLGINGNQVFIGEAAWKDHSYLKVHTYKLSQLKGNGIYVDVSAYVKK